MNGKVHNENPSPQLWVKPSLKRLANQFRRQNREKWKELASNFLTQCLQKKWTTSLSMKNLEMINLNQIMDKVEPNQQEFLKFKCDA